MDTTTSKQSAPPQQQEQQIPAAPPGPQQQSLASPSTNPTTMPMHMKQNQAPPSGGEPQRYQAYLQERGPLKTYSIDDPSGPPATSTHSGQSAGPYPTGYEQQQQQHPQQPTGTGQQYPSGYGQQQQQPTGMGQQSTGQYPTTYGQHQQQQHQQQQTTGGAGQTGGASSGAGGSGAPYFSETMMTEAERERQLAQQTHAERVQMQNRLHGDMKFGDRVSAAGSTFVKYFEEKKHSSKADKLEKEEIERKLNEEMMQRKHQRQAGPASSPTASTNTGYSGPTATGPTAPSATGSTGPTPLGPTARTTTDPIGAGTSGTSGTTASSTQPRP